MYCTDVEDRARDGARGNRVYRVSLVRNVQGAQRATHAFVPRNVGARPSQSRLVVVVVVSVPARRPRGIGVGVGALLESESRDRRLIRRSPLSLLSSLHPRRAARRAPRKGVANRGAPSNRPACYRKQRLGSSARDVTWRSHLEHGSQVRELDALSHPPPQIERETPRQGERQSERQAARREREWEG